MEYGFSQFDQVELFPKGYQIEGESVIPVEKGKEDQVEVEAKDSITSMIKKGEEDLYEVTYQLDEKKLNKDGSLTAPIKKGEKLGEVVLQYKGEGENAYLQGDNEQTVDLVASKAVEKSNWFMLTLEAIGDFFGNIFSTIVDFVKGLFS